MPPQAARRDGLYFLDVPLLIEGKSSSNPVDGRDFEPFATTVKHRGRRDEILVALGGVTGCRERYGPRTRTALWLLAELAITATDVAEVLGAALALKLIFGLPLAWGVVLTALTPCSSWPSRARA